MSRRRRRWDQSFNFLPRPWLCVEQAWGRPPGGGWARTFQLRLRCQALAPAAPRSLPPGPGPRSRVLEPALLSRADGVPGWHSLNTPTGTPDFRSGESTAGPLLSAAENFPGPCPPFPSRAGRGCAGGRAPVPRAASFFPAWETQVNKAHISSLIYSRTYCGR